MGIKIGDNTNEKGWKERGRKGLEREKREENKKREKEEDGIIEGNNKYRKKGRIWTEMAEKG